MNTRDQIIKLRKLIAKLWRRACIADRIAPTAKFVVFSNDNPYAAQHNWAMGRLFSLQNRLKSKGTTITLF